MRATRCAWALIADKDQDEFDYEEVGTAARGDVMDVNMNVKANASCSRSEDEAGKGMEDIASHQLQGA